MASSSFLSRLLTKYNHLRHHIKNAGLKTFVQTKFYDHYIGFKLKAAGVSQYNSSLPAVSSALKDAHENQPSYFYSLKLGLQHVPIPVNEISFLDIGCGNGKVLNYGMLHNFKSVTGIELETSALAIAFDNCTKLKNKGYATPFEITNADAVNYTIPEGVNVIYMFNPFGGQTMEKVALNIIAHINKMQRDIYLVYCMPSFEYVFENLQQCKKIYEIHNKSKTQKELSVYKIIAG